MCLDLPFSKLESFFFVISFLTVRAKNIYFLIILGRATVSET